MVAAPELPCGDPPRARRGREGAGGCVWGGNHSMLGLAVWSPLIMQPQGALWTCQSRLESGVENLRRGLCALGLIRK